MQYCGSMASFRGKDLYAVILLSLIALFLFADQNLMAPNLTQMGDEFGFTDEQRDVKLGGHISLVFWLLGGTITLVIGYFTDRVSRKWLLGAVVVIGEIPCFLTGFAETYTQLFWLRALTGIGIGGAMPLVYSLIGDYFPASKRAAATAFVGLAMGLGIAIGQLVAGALGPTYGWRLPFIIVASPNFALGLLFLATIREPARGRSEAGLADLDEANLAAQTTAQTTDDGSVTDEHGGAITREGYRNLFRVRSNILIFLQGACGTVPWGVFFVYLNDFFAQDKGYTVEAATAIVLAIGAAAIVGSFIGGLAGNWLYNRNPRSLPLLCGITTIAAVIPTAVLINYPAQAAGASDILGPVAFGGLAGFLATVTAPNVRAMLLNVNAPETRGSIFALYNLADDLGRGLGPFFISALIVALGRQYAFNVSVLFWLVCGGFLLLLIRTYPRDEQALNEQMAERAHALQGGQ